MSSLSHLPYGKILDYWHEKLAGNPNRIKFILTKMIEIYSFKTNNKKNYVNPSNFVVFPVLKQNEIPENPKISIVIPVYIKTSEDKEKLTSLLKSIDKQKHPPYEVIVVDDCSPIKLDISGNFIIHHLVRNSGPARARNIGKKIALENEADVIAFTDSDCILSENWVLKILQEFKTQKKYHILSGNTKSFGVTWFDTYHNINGTLNGRRMKGTDKLLYGTTANLAISSEVARKIDFNEIFPDAAGEDIEYCFRANMQGFAIGYFSEMIVYHNYGYVKGSFLKNMTKFSKQFRKYGKGEGVLLEQIPNYYNYFDDTEEISV
ncbi:MAG: glycosyltransferase [Bacteroidota bacterium]|nr:glycosyltransferase [Bacteroidota bacterium]